LHSAIGYITPQDKLEGRAEAILAAREAKLAAAREARKAQRKASCFLKRNRFQSPLCLKKLTAEGRFSHLTGKAICPIPAEPIHTQNTDSKTDQFAYCDRHNQSEESARQATRNPFLQSPPILINLLKTKS
jgi:hypothetical protein